MAILRPDTTTTLNGMKINEYLLTRHNPNRIAMPSVSMESKVIGVTVHNTDWISVASGTTPAEQYTRVTVNGNMKDVRVHYYVDNVCAWQNLPLSLSGWHAADGNGNGNRRTVSIECIMSSAYNDKDKKSEDNCARLAAALLKKYGLDINHLFTHTHWLNVRDGKSGSVDYLNTARNSYKMCPLYILPHWAEFKKKVQGYMSSATTPTPSAPATKQLYRVRKSWSDDGQFLNHISRKKNHDFLLFPKEHSHESFSQSDILVGNHAVSLWLVRNTNVKIMFHRLTAAGYDYNEVQKKVNKLLK